MENTVIELLPLKGCNIFSFGANERDILSIIGEPDEKENFEEEGVDSSIWYYDKLGMSLFFDKLDDGGFILSGLEMEENNLQFDGEKIFGKSIAEIKKLAANSNMGEEEQEMEEWGEIRLSYDDSMIDFYFDEKEKLISISWGMD